MNTGEEATGLRAGLHSFLHTLTSLHRPPSQFTPPCLINMNCRKSKTDQDHPDHSDSLSEPSEPSEQPEMDSQVTPKALHGEFIMEDDLINIHSTYPQSSAHKHRYLAIIATI